MRLSKSQYTRGLNCHKSLWLYRHHPELRQVDESSQARMDAGTEVGILAQQLFPGGVEIAFDIENIPTMVQQTREAIDAGAETLYEATFLHDHVLCMVDILHRGSQGWELHEVKSSTSVKEYHINDASIQWYILSGSGLQLSSAHIVHINNQYVRQGALDIDQLFSSSEITEEVMGLQDNIPMRLQEMREMLNGDEPAIDIGPHCSSPFECDFAHHCWQHIPSPSIFNLYWMSAQKKFELYYKGIVRYEQLPEGFPLNATQKLQVETHASGTPYIDKKVIESFLKQISFPVSFFDFETYQEAVPSCDGQRPYMQMPFQYSLHILHEDGRLEHTEFLADETKDPRIPLADQMLEDIPKEGSILAWNQSFEQNRIRELAEFLPQMKDVLLALNARFLDLIVPFRQRGYYHPKFHGSFSIKSVLPALFPEHAALDYKKLEIQEGGTACETYLLLMHGNMDETERKAKRQALLAYCHLDTLAMVGIYQHLKSLTN